jgi:hypothetical protein
MAELQERQIEEISMDIDQQGLTFTPLKNELLDHICCEIEKEMERGMTFNDAYRKVRTAMGRKRIRQIQDETLTLISKKYRRMKRIMYGLGVAAPVLVITAALFKAYHWPGGGVMITLALFITGMVFLPLFVMVRIRDTRRMDEPVPLALYLTGMISGMIAILGTMFKVQHWPGASIMLVLGLVGLALVFLPAFARYRIRDARQKNEPINKGLWIGGIAAGMLVIIGTLFKIMHWPGAGIALIISWSMLAVVILPLLVLNQLKQSERQINSFFGILLATVSAAVFIMALMRSTPEYYSFGYVVMENSAVGQANYFHGHTMRAQSLAGGGEILMNQVSEADVSPGGDESAGGSMDVQSDDGSAYNLARLSAEADELCSYLQGLREELAYSNSWEGSAPVTKDGAIDARVMYKVGKSSLPYQYIAERDENRMYTMLEAFRDHALVLTEDEALKTFIETQFSFNPPEELDREQWSKFCFTGPLMHSIAILGTFESTVRLVEQAIISNSL